MKKILFILGAFYPKYSANGLCVKNVVDELLKNEYDVTCICNGEKRDAIDVIDGAKIHYVNSRIYQKIISKSELVANEKIKKVYRRISVLQNKAQLLLFSSSWPFVSPLYALNFYRKAKELYMIEKFDIVVSIYTPFESLYAGYLLKRKYSNFKFIPYYLDALAGGWGPSFFSNITVDKHTKKWEKKIAAYADYIISMKSSKDYHNMNPICDSNKRIYLDVPVVKSMCVSSQEENLIFYAGGLNFDIRRMTKILEIFEIICLKLNMKFLLAGSCNNPKIFEKNDTILNGKVQYLGTLAHDDVIKLEKKAKYLVNIGSNNPYTIPCKIFEYMRFGKKIISLYQTDNEPSIEYLDKYKNVIYIDERLSVDTLVSKLINDLQNLKVDENIDLEKEFYENTPSAFVEVVRKISND
ncbi:MAG: glycosyltransferase [Bacilli bacterium]